MSTTTGACDCGRADCACSRLDCDFGWLPDVTKTNTEGRTYTESPPCPECRPELAEIITTAANPQAVIRSRAHRPRKRRGEKLDYRRRGWDATVAAAYGEREQARADLS